MITLDVNQARFAVPLNVLWWHEIVNFTIGAAKVAVTHCPLTGSSLVFDRAPLGGVEFGVSGLLYQSNLMMYDRVTSESLWPQMERGARCGPSAGTELEMVPSIEMRWSEYRKLYPRGLVVSGDLGFGFPVQYNRYPYGSYGEPDNPAVFAPVRDGRDPRRPPKERVLGLPTAAGGMAFPFGSLRDLGAQAAVHLQEEEVVVFWDGNAEAAMAYSVILDGRRLTFDATRDGFLDAETGTRWQIGGEAIDGPLEGRRLDPVAEAYVAFWFAWAAFHPSTTIWSAGS